MKQKIIIFIVMLALVVPSVNEVFGQAKKTTSSQTTKKTSTSSTSSKSSKNSKGKKERKARKSLFLK